MANKVKSCTANVRRIEAELAVLQEVNGEQVAALAEAKLQGVTSLVAEAEKEVKAGFQAMRAKAEQLRGAKEDLSRLIAEERRAAEIDAEVEKIVGTAPVKDSGNGGPTVQSLAEIVAELRSLRTELSAAKLGSVLPPPPLPTDAKTTTAEGDRKGIVAKVYDFVF